MFGPDKRLNLCHREIKTCCDLLGNADTMIGSEHNAIKKFINA